MTHDPQPVRLMAFVRRYGLLHPDGSVQVGDAGPFLPPGRSGSLKKVSREEFERWLLEKPVTENGGYALKKRKQNK